MKQRPKVKSDHTKRFPAHDFILVGLPFQTSRTNNKRVITTFKFCYPRLTLKEMPKVESNHTRRFRADDFVYVGLPSQTSRTNNKRVITTCKVGYPRFTLKEARRSNPITPRDSQCMISYRLVYHPKPLEPIISEL